MVHHSHLASRFLSLVNFTMLLPVYSINLPLSLLQRCARQPFAPKRKPSPDVRTHHHKLLLWLAQPIANAYGSHHIPSRHQARYSSAYQNFAPCCYFTSLGCKLRLCKCTKNVHITKASTTSVVNSCLMRHSPPADVGWENLNKVAQ